MIYDVVELSDSDVSKEEDHRGRRKGAWGNFCKVGGLSPPLFHFSLLWFVRFNAGVYSPIIRIL